MPAMPAMPAMILRDDRRGTAHQQRGEHVTRGHHAPGPMTVTICIIPPCIW